jgi:hypothetical protein
MSCTHLTLMERTKIEFLAVQGWSHVSVKSDTRGGFGRPVPDGLK